MQLANCVTRFIDNVLDYYLKETNSKIYCELSYFKSLLKNEPLDLQRVEAYVSSLSDRKEEFMSTSAIRKLNLSKSREKSLKVTLKPQHDRSKTSIHSINDSCGQPLNNTSNIPLAMHTQQYLPKDIPSKPQLMNFTSRLDKVDRTDIRTESVSSSPSPLNYHQTDITRTDRHQVLKENVQFLANMFSKNTRKLTENDFFEKTRFKKKTVSENKGSGVMER